jgi:hypothetical protein
MVGMVFAAFVSEPLLKAIEYRGMLAEKRGRIVDADTGQGLAGVTITAIWTSGTYDTGWASSSAGCDLQRVVTTDRNGDYTIPSVYGEITFDRIWWKQLMMRSLGMTPFGVGYNWHLVPFKQGYVRVGDESEIPVAAKAPHQPDRSFAVYWNPPSYDAELTYSQLKAIVLRRTKLSPTDEVIYDYALYMRSVCTGYPAVRETMKDSVQDLACALPEDQILDPQVIHAFLAIAGESRFFHSSSALWERNKQPAGLVCQSVGGAR